MPGKHLTESFRWSGARLDWPHAVAASLAMTIPVAAGKATGHLDWGLAASVGGLMIGGLGTLASVREQAIDIALAVAAAIAAMLAALDLLALAPGQFTLVLVASAAALAGGFSVPAAIASTRFVLFLMIAVGMMDGGGEPWLLASMAVAGAIWSALVNLAIGALARSRRGPQEASESTKHTFAQLKARWLRTLKTLTGWQYALRLGTCLAAAIALKSLWPGHHLNWIAITVVLLTERALEAFPVKITQRALGTFVGVIVAEVLETSGLAAAFPALVIAALALGRPLLRANNYLAYTVVTTPLILVILETGKSPQASLLVDRLAATLAGAALVLAANAAMRLAIRASSRRSESSLRR
ncbi:MAG TPA: FUSC family protein [Usitatibacter sp.]|nr:FUSC family protein [Usitatibacter sp.]